LNYSGVPKRLLDCVAGFTAFAILSPLLPVLVLVIRWKLGTPVIFRQQRIGRGDAPFQFFKFRTMTNERDVNGELLPDHLRLTRFGSFLRSSSLDEIPQLWNVVRGDMSLIGPRPLLPQYLPLYSPVQRRRHEVRPGITGLAQVNGRNALAWEAKFELDVRYVDSLSFGLDLQILRQTIASVFQRRGISREGHATSPPFLGSSGPAA